MIHGRTYGNIGRRTYENIGRRAYGNLGRRTYVNVGRRTYGNIDINVRACDNIERRADRMFENPLVFEQRKAKK